MIKFTTNTNKVELSPFSKTLNPGTHKILVFFTNPFILGFGWKRRIVTDDYIYFKGIRFKWYGWNYLPYSTYDTKIPIIEITDLKDRNDRKD